MTYKIRFSKSVTRDIETALAFTRERFGKEQYEIYKQLIRTTLRDLLTDPYRPGARWREELHPAARVYHLSRRGKQARHYFVYRVFEDGTIAMSRMLHDAMDLRRHLPEGFAAGDN